MRIDTPCKHSKTRSPDFAKLRGRMTIRSIVEKSYTRRVVSADSSSMRMSGDGLP